MKSIYTIAAALTGAGGILQLCILIGMIASTETHSGPFMMLLNLTGCASLAFGYLLAGKLEDLEVAERNLICITEM